MGVAPFHLYRRWGLVARTSIRALLVTVPADMLVPCHPWRKMVKTISSTSTLLRDLTSSSFLLSLGRDVQDWTVSSQKRLTEPVGQSLSPVSVSSTSETTADNNVKTLACGPPSLTTVVRKVVEAQIHPTMVWRGDERGYIYFFSEEFAS